MFPARTSRNALPRPGSFSRYSIRDEWIRMVSSNASGGLQPFPPPWKARIADGALGHHHLGFGGPRLPAPLTKCTILPFGILLHCNWAATAGSLAGATLLDSCTAGRLRNCEALNFYSGVLGVAADRNLDVTASGEEANVLVRELDTHAVPLRSSGRVCWASLRHAEGSRAAAPACRLTDAVAPVPVPASRLAI
jgi:hypothetical protein